MIRVADRSVHADSVTSLFTPGGTNIFEPESYEGRPVLPQSPEIKKTLLYMIINDTELE